MAFKKDFVIYDFFFFWLSKFKICVFQELLFLKNDKNILLFLHSVLLPSIRYKTKNAKNTTKNKTIQNKTEMNEKKEKKKKKQIHEKW